MSFWRESTAGVREPERRRDRVSCVGRRPQPASRVADELIGTHQVQTPLPGDGLKDRPDQSHVVIQRQPRGGGVTRRRSECRVDGGEVGRQVAPADARSARQVRGSRSHLQQNSRCGRGQFDQRRVCGHPVEDDHGRRLRHVGGCPRHRVDEPRRGDHRTRPASYPEPREGAVGTVRDCRTAGARWASTSPPLPAPRTSSPGTGATSASARTRCAQNRLPARRADVPLVEPVRPASHTEGIPSLPSSAARCTPVSSLGEVSQPRMHSTSASGRFTHRRSLGRAGLPAG